MPNDFQGSRVVIEIRTASGDVAGGGSIGIQSVLATDTVIDLGLRLNRMPKIRVFVIGG